MSEKTIQAKTYDEAITKALIELQTTSDHLIVETVQEGSSGFFGIGAKPWIIRARVKSEEEEAREEAEKAAAEKAERERKAAEKAAAEKAERERKAEEKAAAEKAERERKAAEKAAAEKKAAEIAAAAAPAEEVREKEDAADAFVKKEEKKPRHRNRKENAARKSEEARPEKQPGTARRRREEPVGREVFEEEAEEIKAKAVGFLKELFRVMEEEIEIDTDFNYQDNELGISLSGGDMGVLIGKRGQTLDSLQYLVSLVVNKHRDVYIRVKLDTENYRERREQKLKSLARNIAQRVKKSRKSVSLEPMNPYERRIIHSALQRDPYVTTYSEGEDPYRHIVVALKKNPKRQDRPYRKQRTGEDFVPEVREETEERQ